MLIIRQNYVDGDDDDGDDDEDDDDDDDDDDNDNQDKARGNDCDGGQRCYNSLRESL